MLKFFYASGTCARATHIALHEAGIAHDAVRIEFSKNAQNAPEYLAVNPKGRVPAVVTDQGVLTETTALLPYVAGLAPGANLLPATAFGLAEMQGFNAYLAATVHVAHAHKVRGSRWANDPAAIEAMKAKVAENMAACFDLIEGTYLRGPWVMGDQYTVADGYLYTIAGWLPGDGVEMARFPKVADHFARMTQRPAVARVLAVEA